MGALRRPWMGAVPIASATPHRCQNASPLSTATRSSNLCMSRLVIGYGKFKSHTERQLRLRLRASECNGAPKRVGLCHCQTCQKIHGSAFNPFVVFGKEQVVLAGKPASWMSSPGYQRLFCPHCGSRIGASTGVEVELSLAVFDGTVGIAPQYEAWVVRRWPWLVPLPVPQHEQNRP